VTKLNFESTRSSSSSIGGFIMVSYERCMEISWRSGRASVPANPVGPADQP
jgi:hypothetical protein